MIKAATHVYLVSAQATPNITPALDNDVRPDTVVLIVSPDMEKQAVWLKNVLQSAAGIKVTFCHIQNPWDISHIQDKVLEMIASLDEESIALNATGGTKPMSIGAYEVFRAAGKPIFYVHPERDELVWLYPSNQESHLLANRVKLRQYIESYGGSVVSMGAASVLPSYRDFAEMLIQNIEVYANSLGTLNFYANSAERDLTSEALDSAALNNRALNDLVDKLSDIGVLRRVSGCLCFVDEEARFFANGGWLEQYVLSTLNSLKKELPIIQDVASSVEIERGNGVKNEFDVVCLAENKIKIIECKAKNFQSSGRSSGAETLYKLDSLAEAVGGMKAKALLVSYRQLTRYDKERANEMGITIIEGEELKMLKEKLINWVK